MIFLLTCKQIYMIYIYKKKLLLILFLLITGITFFNKILIY